MPFAHKRALSAILAASALALSITGCSSASGTGAATANGHTNVTLWTHNAGNPPELKADQQEVAAFNASQTKVTVKLQAFPQQSYNTSVVAAAAAGKLPCIVDIDAPNVPNWAWAKYLTPLKLSTDLSKSLPSTVGKWNGTVYSVGQYDVALGMFARKSVLDAAGIRIPTIAQPWTEQELSSALAKLKAEGKWQYPLDLQTAGGGEWLPYAYSPFLQSFGGDLINRKGYQSADGVLNGPQAIAFASWFQGLIKSGYIAQKSGKDSNADFQNGKTAILYSGSWSYSVLKPTVGSDLLSLPTVDLGNGPKVGGGSWQWGVTGTCPAKAAAMSYLSYTMLPKNIALVAKATGNIPATAEAAALVPGFQPGGEFDVFRQFSKDYAVVRPVTPAYPFISTEFQTAMQDIIAGGAPKAILDTAVKNIDNNIKQNYGYKQH